MKKISIILLIISLSTFAVGQESTSKNRELTLKIPISSFFGDIYTESAGMGIGIEKAIKPSLSISQELTYIFHVQNSSKISEDLENINGLKLTTEFRKYLSKKEIPESGWFINTEMKNIFTKSLKQSLTINNISVENEITRYRGLLSANLGILFYWDKNKEGNITLELMGGGGLAYINANSTNELLSETSYSSDKGFYPWLNFDVKIGFVLR